jgi:pyroglutamyl-peptidase
MTMAAARCSLALRLRGFVLAALVAAVACDEEGGQGPALFIGTEVLPMGRVAMAYEAPLEAVDTEGTVQWSVVGGELPPGLSLSAEGVIAGTPELSGDYAFTVRAHDDAGTDEVDLSIEVPLVVLMSGFEPFGGYDTNPSIDSIAPLHEQIVAGLDVRTIELEVSWSTSWDDFKAEIERLSADVVIGTGMSETDAMRFETQGQNDTWGTDNYDEYLDHEPVLDGGPETTPATMPIAEMAAAMTQGGYATLVSDNAGNYLCNYVFYNLSYYAANEAEREIVVGFIHVPPAPYSGTFTVADVTAAHRLGLGAIEAWLESGDAADEAVPAEHAAPAY